MKLNTIQISDDGIVLTAGLMSLEIDRRLFKIESNAADSLLMELYLSKTLRYESETRSVYLYKSPDINDWINLHPFVRRGMIGKCYQNNTINVQKCIGEGWVCAIDNDIQVSPSCILKLFYKLPTAVQQMKNLSLAFVQAARTGTLTTHVKEETFALRKAICQGCEYFDPTAFLGTGRCRVCGCGEAKLRMPSQSCPKEKWGAE